jgi:hypothetical protein
MVYYRLFVQKVYRLNDKSDHENCLLWTHLINSRYVDEKERKKSHSFSVKEMNIYALLSFLESNQGLD